MSRQTAIKNVNDKILEDRKNGVTRVRTDWIDRRLNEIEEEERQKQEEQRRYSQYQAQQNAELAEWIKGTSPTALEDRAQEERIKEKERLKQQSPAIIADWIKSTSPLELEKEEQRQRVEELNKKNTSTATPNWKERDAEYGLTPKTRPGQYTMTPELEAQYQYANGVRPQTQEQGTNKLTPQAEFMYEYITRKNNRNKEEGFKAPEAPAQRMSADWEAEYQRRARGEDPGTALTPYAQYMQSYNAQREKDAARARDKAESGWPSAGYTAVGMAANALSGVGQPLINMARMGEGISDMLYRNTGKEIFNLDRTPGMRTSEALKASDQLAETAQEMRGKVGKLGQQLIDSAGAAGNMLSSFAFWGNAANAAGGALNATAKLANLGGNKVVSALGRAGARIGTEILSNPGNFGVSLGSGLSGFSDAYADGASFAGALANGVLKGLTEYYSNKLFSGTPYEDTAEKGYVTRLIEAIANDLGGSKVLQAINTTTGGQAMNWILDKAGEGMEEVVTGFAEPLIDRLTYNPEADLATAAELTDEFIGGVLLSLLMEGGEAVLGKLENPEKMTEREVMDRLKKLGISQEDAKKYAPDLAEAMTALLQDTKMQRADYAEKSVGDPEIAAKAGENPSLQRYADVYNRSEARQELQRNPGSVSEAAYLTDNEAGNYFYIWNNQGAQAADAYYDQYLKPSLDARRTAAVRDYIQQAAREEQRQRIAAMQAAYDEARSVLGISDSFANTPPVPRASETQRETQQMQTEMKAAAEERQEPPVPEQRIATPPAEARNDEGLGTGVPSSAAAAAPSTEGRQGPPVLRAQEEQGTEERTATEPAAPRNDGGTETARSNGKKTKVQTAVAQLRKKQMENARNTDLRSLGFETAGEGGTVYVRTEDMWDKEERAAAEALRAEGYDPVLYTGQGFDSNGKMVSVLQEGNRVALNSSDRSKSITSLAETVLGHGITETPHQSPAATVSPRGSQTAAEETGSPSSVSSADTFPPGKATEETAAAGVPSSTAEGAPSTQGKAGTEGPKLRVKRQEGARAKAARESALQAGASEETANQVARLAKILNKDIRCVNEPERNGAVKNGWTQDGVIYYNVAGNERPLAWVVGHELTHNTEHAKTYEKLAALTKRVYGKQWDAAVRQLMAERAEVARRLGDSNVEIDRNETEREIVANFFADNLLTNEDMIREVVENDAPTARRILNYLKDLLRKWQGKEPTIERAIDLYSKALKEVAMGAQEKGETRSKLRVKGDQAQSAQDIRDRKYSVKSIFDAAGFRVTLKGGRVIARDGSGKQITEMTEDMVRRSGIGTMIRYAQEVTKSISKQEADTQIEGLTRLFNLMLKAQDGDMVWRFAGSAMFSAVKSNSDGQYSTTVDFSTVCKKTEEMMRTMSTVMMKTHKGLTKDQIIELQNDILAENGLVPCPVCYVFSRWAGVGGILDNMAKFQKKYDGAEWDDPAQMKARIDQLKAATKTKKALQALLMEEDNAYQQFTGELEANQAEQKTLRAEKKSLTGKKADAAANAARVAEIDKRMKELDGLNALLKADIQTIEKSGAPEAAWLERVRSKPNYRDAGYVEEDLLYNLLAADRLAEEKPLAWGYRTSRGPSAGKAILPYSDMRVGDWVLGPKANSAKGANPLFSSVGEQFSKDQTKAIDAAKMKVLAQNLIGGQRYQSTSDFMYDYGLDYLLSFFEGQMLGSKMQTYTKVMEFVNLVASVHGDVNISMMPLDAGYITEADGRQHLIYSSVTGANPEAAIRANHLFDNAQLILVGINDQHILLALEDSEETGGAEIGFVIPYHASGASINNFIRGLVENLKETFDEKNYKNYEPMQNDSHRKNATAAQEARERLRRYLLTGKRGKSDLRVSTGNPDGLTDTEMKLLKGRSKDISDRSFEELREIEKRALAGDKAAIKEYESWSAGFLGDLYKKLWTNEKAKDTYGVRLTGDQPDHIMPHEFWDTRVDREHAYINGFRFRSYCYSLGLTPRFTGVNSAGKHLGYGDFSDSKGYWKTLIDRPMYDRSGKYRDQQTMNVTELSGSFSEENAGMLSPEYGREFWGENAQTPNTGVAARAAERYLERNEEKPQFSARAEEDDSELQNRIDTTIEMLDNNQTRDKIFNATGLLVRADWTVKDGVSGPILGRYYRGKNDKGRLVPVGKAGETDGRGTGSGLAEGSGEQETRKRRNWRDLTDNSREQIIRAVKQTMKKAVEDEKLFYDTFGTAERFAEAYYDLYRQGDVVAEQWVNLIPEYTKFKKKIDKIYAENEGASKTEGYQGKPSYSAELTDKAYLSAVESGDMVTAQRMVDEAAKKAGYDYVRYTRNRLSPKNNNADYYMFTEWGNEETVRGVYGDNKTVAGAENAIEAADIIGELRKAWEDYADDHDLNREITDKELNPDDIVMSAGVWDDRDFVTYLFDRGFFDRFTEAEVPALRTYDGLIVFGDDTKRIKSADPVTYDDKGKVIPLSKRFNRKLDEIRYSAELTDRERSAEALEERTLGGRRLLDTPALKKLGVKVNGSVGRYANTEQLMAKTKAAKQLKKAAADAERRLQATEAEKDFASGIAAMVYDEEDIPARLRRDVVMELADYYFASDSANLETLAKLRADINAGLRAEAGDLLEEADFKPMSMIMLNERTPERNFRRMFGEKGNEITEWLIQPVRENEAQKIRWFNEQMDKVRTFKDSTGKTRKLTKDERALTMKYMEGKAAAQMVADLETDQKNRYGKQQAKNIKNAAENIRKGGSAADAAKEFSLSDRERDLAEKYAAWQNTLQELESADTAIVEAAAKKYSELFDDYYAAINDFLAAHGYEPIGYIKGYAPHMQPEESQSALKEAIAKLTPLGINEKVTELPASIAGETANFKPNKRWDPYFLQRTGKMAEYDIEKAFESYVKYMSDVLFHTDDIMRARQLVRWIRQTYAPEETKSKLDYIDTIRNAPTETKAELLRDAGEIGRTTVMSDYDIEEAMQKYVEKLFERAGNTSKYSNLVMWLDNYANILAGKQSYADRGIEHKYDRKWLNIGNRINAMFQRSNVPGNLSSVLNQGAQLPMIAAELGERDFLGAIYDIVSGKTRQGTWAQDSDFLIEKEGMDYLYADNADKFINALYAPASWMDHLVSTVAVRGAFNKAIRQGKSYQQAMRYADDFGRKLMGSRAKGSRPLAYESKGPIDKLIHMFQVECANSWDHIASDLPAEIKEIAKTQGKAKAARTLAALIIRALLGTFLLNRATEEIYGGTPAPFDILGLTANFIASGQGLTTNRWMKKIIDNGLEKMGAERIFGTDADEGNKEFKASEAIKETAYNVMNDLPLLRNVMGTFGLGDQTIALPGAGGEFKAFGKAAWAMLDKGVEEGEVADLLRATLNLATQFAPGGRQIRKTAEGAEAAIRGGSYKNGKLQYPVEGFGDTARALLFGKNATQAAREYWAAGGKALSEKQTQVYEEMTKGGMTRGEAYDAIREFKKIANDKELESLEKGIRERDLINGLDISDDLKNVVYSTLADAESRGEKFDAIMETGLSFDEVKNVYDKFAEIDSDDDKKANEKAKEFELWVDKQGFSKDQTTVIKDQFKYFNHIPAEAERYETMLDLGLEPDTAAAIDQAISALTPLPEHDGVTDAQRWNAALKALGSTASTEEKLSVIGTIVGTNMTTDSGNPSRWAKINQVVSGGQSVENTMAMIEDGTFDTYVKWMDTGLSPNMVSSIAKALTSLKPLPGHEGITNAQKWNAVLNSVGSNVSKQKKMELVSRFFDTEMKTKSGEPSQWAKVNKVADSGLSVEETLKLVENEKLDVYVKWLDSDAKTAGVKSDTYIAWREKYNTTKSTRDENGKEVKGQTKKDKVLAYIDSLNLTKEQKDALFLEEYKESGLKDTPWHKSGGGKGSGSYAPARLRVRKQPWETGETEYQSRLRVAGAPAAAPGGRLRVSKK